MNLLSETAVWRSTAEFVDAEGNISSGIGESRIEISAFGITNESWLELKGNKIINNYQIFKEDDHKYQFQSDNMTLGIQKGCFNVDRNILFSKFVVEGTDLNGFEIIVRNKNECHAKGALYKNDQLVNSWRAVMVKKPSGVRMGFKVNS